MTRPISIAIAALGGQGGGVLADWLVAVAELHGWLVQSTSVPGVAQRTGTTVYYVETAAIPEADSPLPNMALMPTPGDVDLVVAAELMEAGRAVLRGFVTPDRTTLIASRHRVYGITEKSALGDGIVDSNSVLAAARAEAKRLICFDMDAIADEQQTVISAVLLGAIAASGALPFPRALYEQAIRDAGISVQGSLAGFEAGFHRALRENAAPETTTPGPDPSTADGRRLDQRARRVFPAHLHAIVAEGLRRMLDYQDRSYATLYLDRLERVLRQDASLAIGTHDFDLTAVVARYLALWMSYEDTIRVADLKTRSARFRRVHADVRAAAGQIVHVTDYMHPRFQEICETLPAGLGAWLFHSATARRIMAPLFRRGRHIATTRLRGFLLLYLLAGFRPMRRHTLRYRIEQQRIEAWLETIDSYAARHYRVGAEIAECGRLIKGYGDTHERGLKSYTAILAIVRERAPDDATAALVRTLRSAALADEDGRAFAAVLASIDARATSHAFAV